MMRVEEWRKKGLLNIAFEKGLSYNTVPATYFFDSIYAPIRLPTASGMPAGWTYQPVGWTYSDIADIYGMRFGGNFWPQWFKDAADLNAAISAYECMAVETIVSTLHLNELKYKKLIELQGYSFNPLWNVDGTELHSTIEQHADETERTNTDFTSTSSAAPYDSATFKDAAQTRDSGTATNNYRKKEHTQTAHAVAATDNAFGEALSGGDVYHAEKTVRQGNIGVTKTTELIDSARASLEWSLLNVFFEDLNKNLLIGIF